MRWRVGVVSWMVMASSYPTRAHACSPLHDGKPPVRLFGPDAEVPGNLVYFKLLVDEPGPLSLSTQGGQTIPASVRVIGTDRVFAPTATVPAGLTLVLRYQGRSGARLTEEKYTFRTLPPRAMKLRAPELSVTERGLGYPDDERNRTAFYRVRYYSPDEDSSISHLLDVRPMIDGRPLPLDASSVFPPSVLVETACGSAREPDWSIDTCGDLRQVPRGEHTLEIAAHVIGSEVKVPSVKRRLSLDCSAFDPPRPAPAGPSSVPAPRPPARGTAISCSLGSPAPARCFTPFALFALLGASLGRLAARGRRNEKVP